VHVVIISHASLCHHPHVCNAPIDTDRDGALLVFDLLRDEYPLVGSFDQASIWKWIAPSEKKQKVKVSSPSSRLLSFHLQHLLFITLLLPINFIRPKRCRCALRSLVLDLDPIHLHSTLDDIHTVPLLFPFHSFVYHLPQTWRANECSPFIHRFFLGQQDWR
jgi:hypothetical protein